MKYRILESFTDKYDNSLYYVKDEVIEFTKKRAKEILEVGNLIEEFKEVEMSNQDNNNDNQDLDNQDLDNQDLDNQDLDNQDLDNQDNNNEQ